jgi:hypothetical protein
MGLRGTKPLSSTTISGKFGGRCESQGAGGPRSAILGLRSGAASHVIDLVANQDWCVEWIDVEFVDASVRKPIPNYVESKSDLRERSSDSRFPKSLSFHVELFISLFVKSQPRFLRAGAYILVLVFSAK